MRPFHGSAFAPSCTARESVIAPTKRGHLRPLRLARVGLAQRPPARRPGSTRSIATTTRVAFATVALNVVPRFGARRLRRAALALPPLATGAKTALEIVKLVSVSSGGGPPAAVAPVPDSAVPSTSPSCASVNVALRAPAAPGRKRRLTSQPPPATIVCPEQPSSPRTKSLAFGPAIEAPPNEMGKAAALVTWTVSTPEAEPGAVGGKRSSRSATAARRPSSTYTLLSRLETT